MDDLLPQDAAVKEMEFIKLYGRINNKTGVLANLSDGGEGNIGYVVSDETKEKLRVASLGRPKSPEEIEKIRKNTSKRYTCDVCGHTTNAPNMAKHFGLTGHSGRSANLMGFMA